MLCFLSLFYSLGGCFLEFSLPQVFFSFVYGLSVYLYQSGDVVDIWEGEDCIIGVLDGWSTVEIVNWLFCQLI